jgi:hypothetical protein
MGCRGGFIVNKLSFELIIFYSFPFRCNRLGVTDSEIRVKVHMLLVQIQASIA